MNFRTTPGDRMLVTLIALGGLATLVACGSSGAGVAPSPTHATNDGGVSAIDGSLALSDASPATDSGGAGPCSTLGPAVDVAAEADASDPPPPTGGTIVDGTYRLKHFIFYRRATPPNVMVGGSLRFQGLIEELATGKDSLSGNWTEYKARMEKTPDGAHLRLAECLCTQHGGGCSAGVGVEQPYSVVGTALWTYQRDTSSGGGGDLAISVYDRE